MRGPALQRDHPRGRAPTGRRAPRRARHPARDRRRPPLRGPRWRSSPWGCGSWCPPRPTRSQAALGDQHQLRQAARESTGIKHDVLVALDRKLSDIPSGSSLVDPAVEYGRKAFEVLIGTFFVLAASAYWIVERDRAVDLVCSLLPRPRRKTVRDTWDLIELRLGAFVRGQAVLVALVATVLSACFWAIGLPYWLLVGVFAGVVEIVPVIGPLAAARRRHRRRPVGVGSPRRPRRARRGRRAAARGLRRPPPRARALGGALAARGARLGDDGRPRARRVRGDPRGAAREHPRHA